MRCQDWGRTEELSDIEVDYECPATPITWTCVFAQQAGSKKRRPAGFKTCACFATDS